MAKKFFYVCAGLLMLGLAFHLGVASVSAQGPATTLSCAEVVAGGATGGVINRVLVRWNGADGAGLITDPCPGTSPIIAVDAGNLRVVLDNGDVWTFAGAEPGWHLTGNMLTNVLTAPQGVPASQLRIEVSPVPSRDRIGVRFRLERSESVDLELLDPQGRMLSHESVGTLPAGAHSVQFNLGGAAGGIAPGTYFVRIRHGSSAETARAIVVK